MSGRIYDIEIRRHGDLDLDVHLDEINELIAACVRKFPDGVCEGVITLGNTEQFYTCANKGSKVHLVIGPRDVAEAMFNEHGYSTIEEWSPWTRHDA